MWDFDKLPKEKLEAVKKVLVNIKISKTFKDYQDIPVTERLEIMEKVYAVLEKDEDWWENFYRVKGYHDAKAGMVDKAETSRKKSLELIEKALESDKNEIPLKLLLYISGVMKHFLNNDEGALTDLQKALTTKYAEKDAKPEDLCKMRRKV